MPRHLPFFLIATIVIFFYGLFFYILSKNAFGSYDTRSIQNSNDVLVERKHPIIWRTMQMHMPYAEEVNQTDDVITHCRNSVQGVDLLVDERGYVCTRKNLLTNGCCDIEKSDAFNSCNTCSESTHCCAIYEYCVSCCLLPAKKSLLELVLQKATGRQAVIFAAVRDQYELCLVKCRTSSHSVVRTKYKSSHAKYCYGPTEECIPKPDYQTTTT